MAVINEEYVALNATIFYCHAKTKKSKIIKNTFGSEKLHVFSTIIFQEKQCNRKKPIEKRYHPALLMNLG